VDGDVLEIGAGGEAVSDGGLAVGAAENGLPELGAAVLAAQFAQAGEVGLAADQDDGVDGVTAGEGVERPGKERAA